MLSHSLLLQLEDIIVNLALAKSWKKLYHVEQVSSFMNASVDVTALIEQVDIVKEISKYVQLKPKAQEYTGCCPFHQEATPFLC